MFEMLGGPLLDYNNLTVPQYFSLQVANLPRSSSTLVQQAADSHLRVMSTKVRRGASFLLPLHYHLLFSFSSSPLPSLRSASVV